jgi:hypothetical protein
MRLDTGQNIESGVYHKGVSSKHESGGMTDSKVATHHIEWLRVDFWGALAKAVTSDSGNLLFLLHLYFFYSVHDPGIKGSKLTTSAIKGVGITNMH